MFTRISSASLLLLAGCAQPAPDTSAIAAVEAETRAKVEDDGRVVCALDGSSDFARVCTVDRVAGDEGLTLTVRHPDGAFRRLLVTRDGRGVIAADGAEAARVTIVGADRIEVALADDRYLLPAKVGPVAAP